MSSPVYCALIALEVPSHWWLWSVVPGVVAALVVWALLRTTMNRRLTDLQASIGGGESTSPSGSENWDEAFSVIERLRDSARRTDRLLLHTGLLEDQHEVATEALDALPDGVVVLDSSEQVRYANAMARNVLGMGSRDNLNLDQMEGSLQIVDGIRSVMSADLARTVKSRRVEWRREDQVSVFVIRSLSDGDDSARPASHVVLLEDLTIEEEAARAKSEFIYGVSHELKTPLTAIQASLEMVDDEPDLDVDTRKQLVNSAYTESVRLSQMVTELLDLARVEAGMTEFKQDKVAMDQLLADLQSFHVPLARRKSIGLQWDVSNYIPDTIGDQGLLRQALVNIVGNAVKYTKSGGEVSLTARLEGPDLVIRVSDTGIGIAADDLPRVFEKFYRATSAEKSRIQGTGLGLPMARYIIERHQGRVEVTSELQVGTKFTVYLPSRVSDSDGEENSPQLLVVDTGSGL